jgi:hypothetical protein
MMRAEVEDAFKVRKWVVVFLIAGALSGVFAAWEVLSWVGYIWRNWEKIGTTTKFPGEF